MKPRRSTNSLRHDSRPGLSWEETAREMAAANEDWSEWDVTLADGLDDIPWEPAPIARARLRHLRHEVEQHAAVARDAARAADRLHDRRRRVGDVARELHAGRDEVQRARVLRHGDERAEDVRLAQQLPLARRVRRVAVE